MFRAFARPAAWALIAVAASAPLAHGTALPPGGVMPEALRQAFASGVLDVRNPHALGTSATQTYWNIPVIMVAFADLPLTYTPADFDTALFDTTGRNPYGSVSEYWYWASGGRIRITGKVVGAVTLTQPLSYYGFNYWGLRVSATPSNMFGALREALQDTSLRNGVDWSPYDTDQDGYVDMLWMIHAGQGGETLHDYNSFWSVTSRCTGGWASGAPLVTGTPVPGSTTQYIRIDRFTSLPEVSGIIPTRHAEIGTFCHEFGHALGLPDLYDVTGFPTVANYGPGFWSLMATGNYGADGISPELPSHPGAWVLQTLGWLTPVHPAHDTTITLSPLESGGSAVDVNFEGEDWPEHFLIENRQRLGFDSRLMSQGLLIEHLDDVEIDAHYASNTINGGLTPGLIVVEADGNFDMYRGVNRGDAEDIFPGPLGVTQVNDLTRPSLATFDGAPTQLALGNIVTSGHSVTFTLQVEAPGWQSPEDHTDPGYSPIDTYGPAQTASQGMDGTIALVKSELVGGRPQVVLRMRVGGVWQAPQTASDSPGSALNPTLAALPGGGYVVAWSDSRAGGARIVCRTYLGGAWGPQQALSPPTGSGYQPALATDSRGIVYATWLQVVANKPYVQFMRFAYTSPWGAARTLTDTTQVPGVPGITVTPDGKAFITWADQHSFPLMFFFSRFREDSGLTAPLPLIPPPIHQPTTLAAVADPQGRLHSVWIELQSGANEIHYERRDFTTFGWLRDSILEVRTDSPQNPTLALDSQGGLHLAYECVSGSLQQIRYKRFLPGLGWDARSTAVTGPGDGDAVRPAVVPISPGRVTVLYTGSPADNPRFMLRSRTLDPAPVLSSPTPVAADASGRLHAWPDPLPRGRSLRLLWAVGSSPSSPRMVDVFDLAGRRVAEATLHSEADGLAADLGPALTSGWPAGLYFVRARGAAAVARLVVLP